MLINDLSARMRAYDAKIMQAAARVVASGWLVLGPEVRAFEAAFANYVGASTCVSVANGTDAIELTLKGLGVGPGDKVATVANAGMYTTTAALAVGAEPFFMDVDPGTGNVTLQEVERALDAGVKVIVVTHLYGQAIHDIARIATSCASRGAHLVEDCAQAHGAKVDGKRVGSFGDAATFSFYPTKNLGALGDGGAVVTSDEPLAQRILRLRQYGWTSKYQVEVAGARNSRLDELQAAFLLAFLPDLDAANHRRREIANAYGARIDHPAVSLPTCGGEDSVAHLYVIRSSRRDALRAHLKSLDIATEVHYPVPDHRQPVFAGRFADVHLPRTEQMASEILTIPCFPEMSDADILRVADAVNSWDAGQERQTS